MGFPVTVETEDGLEKVEVVRKIDGNRLVDTDGIVYERTTNALVFKPTGDQLSLFEVNEPGDELTLAGTEPEAEQQEGITPVEQFEMLLNESADRELAEAVQVEVSEGNPDGIAVDPVVEEAGSEEEQAEAGDTVAVEAEATEEAEEAEAPA